MKPELLLPAGNKESLRAAVANGADAVYLGLSRFNARENAENFNEMNIGPVIRYCRKRGVKVYITANTLVRNSEMLSYLQMIGSAKDADAVIIQDPYLIPLLKRSFPGLAIHMSTQSTITNSAAIPKGADRIILPRELTAEQVKQISSRHETEIFIHGALCISYSGQCLFSSVVGGRSGNRGKCAQPCRVRYNNSYPLSTMDLCMLQRLPEVLELGVKAIKVEGRMRGPTYVGTVARIYRKYLDIADRQGYEVSREDLKQLKLAFNREFTEGFCFTGRITDKNAPMNRGLCLGKVIRGNIKLKDTLKPGDGISVWRRTKVHGLKLERMLSDDGAVTYAEEGDIVHIPGTQDNDLVFKTSSDSLDVDLGDELVLNEKQVQSQHFTIPAFNRTKREKRSYLHARVYKGDAAIEAAKAGADYVYLDIFDKGFLEVKKEIGHRLYGTTKRILTDEDLDKAMKRIDEVRPSGMLVTDRGLAEIYEGPKHYHYSLNAWNDIDLDALKGPAVISPELGLEDLKELKHEFMAFVHGDIVLMTLKEYLAAPELVDDEGRHFRVRTIGDCTEILNSQKLGLFSKANQLYNIGVRHFYLDLDRDVRKILKIYRRILSLEKFDDNRIRKGYTTGHFSKGM